VIQPGASLFLSALVPRPSSEIPSKYRDCRNSSSSRSKFFNRRGAFFPCEWIDGARACWAGQRRGLILGTQTDARPKRGRPLQNRPLARWICRGRCVPRLSGRNGHEAFKTLNRQIPILNFPHGLSGETILVQRRKRLVTVPASGFTVPTGNLGATGSSLPERPCSHALRDERATGKKQLAATEFFPLVAEDAAFMACRKSLRMSDQEKKREARKVGSSTAGT
jgi:hypothetical protein